MSKEFDRYCASIFSWSENIDKNEVELHEMTWGACKTEVLKILDKYSNSPDVKYIKEEVDKL